ncbi:DUF4367 domain-containing protein [Anaerocolumna sp. MB42-C2]|uniref:DUF4367 domain-containing protein n=1 Tax=Anaerocolumna sp. MB42-C2 TaxID=3070997 RepID=UPI0027E10311|nr:DUF4367 domain-containing protein [Anaerocolumna sp. MB42-C2]WMJ85572.1 DUF4367 domain-containing protein [Anaerocolumna sp. MB42-C2]
MTNKKNTSNEKSNADIIKSIYLEKDNDIATRDRLYKLLYQASEEDEFSMDTDLIKECVDTINLIEGDNEQISEEKIMITRQNIESQYKKGYKTGKRKHFLKIASMTVASILLVLSLSNVLAYSFGFNIIDVVSNWGADNFNLFTQPKSEAPGNNVTSRVIDTNIKEAFKDINPKPLLPGWLPDGFSFKYVEKYNRKDSINILLYYDNEIKDNSVIIFDYTIYVENQGSDISYEKDDRLVEIYKKDGEQYYILENENQIQAIWNDSNTIYNVNGDISADEIKKIINHMEVKNNE